MKAYSLTYEMIVHSLQDVECCKEPFSLPQWALLMRVGNGILERWGGKQANSPPSLHSDHCKTLPSLFLSIWIDSIYDRGFPTPIGSMCHPFCSKLLVDKPWYIAKRGGSKGSHINYLTGSWNFYDIMTPSIVSLRMRHSVTRPFSEWLERRKKRLSPLSHQKW